MTTHDLRIPAIVGSDSADRGHPRKAFALVTAIFCSGGHDGSIFGLFRECHDDDAGNLPSNPIGGHFAAVRPVPHRPRWARPDIRANDSPGSGWSSVWLVGSPGHQ